MKSKTMILMGVAVICGLGASYLTSRLLAERSEKVTVLIPKQRYLQWTHIKDPTTMFEEKEILKTESPKTAVTKFDDLKDRILLRNLPEGQPVVLEDLQPKDKGSLDTQLPIGKRAVAIKTDATKTAGGFVLPGSRVDVLHTGRSGDSMEAKCILQDILVRAVDLQSVKPEDKQGVVPATVTVEVTPEEAIMLARYQDSGALTLSLRPVGDDARVAAAEPPVSAPPPPRIDDGVRKTLTIYNGPHWTQATFVTKHGEVTTQILESGQSDLSPALGAGSQPAAATKPGAGPR